MHYFKHFGLLFGVLLFVGAGCGSAPEPTPEPLPQSDKVMETSADLPAGEAEESTETPKEEEKVSAAPTEAPKTLPEPTAEKADAEEKVQPKAEETAPAPKAPEKPTTPKEKVVETKTFNVTAKKWEFSPSTITVNEGDVVVMHVTSVDVDHGIAITAFGVNETLKPGVTKTIQFVADKKGTYSFFCSVFCGSGHSSMAGTLIVK